MAVSPAKTFVAGEVLFASDLNAEFLNVYNGGENLAWPATKAKDFAGQGLTLDSGGLSSLSASTDNLLVLALKGANLFRWDGTTGSPVNGLDFIAGITGTAPQIKGFGTDTNISINLVPKCSGDIMVRGVPLSDTVRRAAAMSVVSRTVKLRVMHAEGNRIGEAQSLGF